MINKRSIYLFVFVLNFAFIFNVVGAKKPMNVVFIAIDDMNNWIGEWGGQAKTPNIDKLANQGMKFLNAHCVVPACNPSRAALMTGQRPETTGQYTNAGDFRDKPGGKERETLAQYLRKYGYNAVAAGKIFHHPRGSRSVPNKRSDDISWNEQWVGVVGTTGKNKYLDENGWAKWLEGDHMKYISGDQKNSGMNYMCKAGIWGPIDQPKEQTGDWKMAEFGADFLQKKHNKPFFLACGIFRPHSPQLAPKEFFDLYPLNDIEMPETPADDMDDIPEIAQENFSTPFVKLMKEKKEWRKAVQGYLACMSYADACVGVIMDALEKSEYSENTMVVFWTDHGWQLGHKNRWEKFSHWDQATNSPMIIKYPGMKTSGKSTEEAVSFLDIYPTVLDVLDIEQPGFLEGETLMPFLKDAEYDRKKPAIVTYPDGNYSVKLDNWNYILYKDGSEELYNHNNDPREFNNLAKSEKFQDVMQNLRRWVPESKNP